MNNKKDKSKSEKSKPKTKATDYGKTIYIGNLNYKRDKEGIKLLFSKFGKVKSVELMTDPETEKKLGYAFVKMYKTPEALLAIKNLNGKIVDGRTLKVSEANNRFESHTERPKEKVKETKKVTLPPIKKKRKTNGLQKLLNYIDPPLKKKVK